MEVLSWAHSCNQGIRRWAEANGVFVPLDDHYEAIAFCEPSRPGNELAPARDSGTAGTITPPHGVTDGGPPLARRPLRVLFVALPAPLRPLKGGSGLRASSRRDGRATAFPDLA